MSRKLLLVLVILSVILGSISGCFGEPAGSSEQTTPTNTQRNEVAGSDLMAGIEATPFTGTAAFNEDDVKAIQLFAANLLDQAAQNEGNIMISPASIFLALAMTLNGADTSTRDAMLQTLTDGQLSVDQVNAFSRSWMTYLSQTGSKTKLEVANSIWFRDGFVPFEPFLEANAVNYHAAAQALDFSSQSGVDTINQWVDDATNGLIDKMIEQISPTTVMFLINTIYFKSDWQTPFEKAATSEQVFQSPDGDQTVPFMQQITPLSVFTLPNATGVMLPYDNSQFGYFAILPDPSITPRDWYADQDSEQILTTLHQTITEQEPTPVHLALPVYEAEYEDSLIDDLDRLGMGIAFGGSADFSRLNANRSKGLYISEVKHKTVIRVNEKGTEAAAATSVAIDESAPGYEKELIFNRPFLYGIIDLQFGLPLFIGILENPAAD
jgi:serpin B